jgi:YfiH family protein
MHDRPMIIDSPFLRHRARHGFVTRHGGVSVGPFASMNLVRKWGDEPAAVDENLRRLRAAGGFDLLFVAKQVHGDRCVTVEADTTPEAIADTEADALLTRVKGVALAVSTADCVPILFAGAGVVAAAHAGWRGTVKGIGPKTIAAMGVAAVDSWVALGPSICVRCFEVGEEVAAEFSASVVRRDLGPKPHVDLQRANVDALVAAGVPPDHIDGAPPCTMCEPERFYSFRRDHGKTGGHLSFIVCG